MLSTRQRLHTAALPIFHTILHILALPWKLSIYFLGKLCTSMEALVYNTSTEVPFATSMQAGSTIGSWLLPWNCTSMEALSRRGGLPWNSAAQTEVNLSGRSICR